MSSPASPKQVSDLLFDLELSLPFVLSPQERQVTQATVWLLADLWRRLAAERPPALCKPEPIEWPFESNTLANQDPSSFAAQHPPEAFTNAFTAPDLSHSEHRDREVLEARGQGIRAGLAAAALEVAVLEWKLAIRDHPKCINSRPIGEFNGVVNDRWYDDMASWLGMRSRPKPVAQTSGESQIER